MYNLKHFKPGKLDFLFGQRKWWQCNKLQEKLPQSCPHTVQSREATKITGNGRVVTLQVTEKGDHWTIFRKQKVATPPVTRNKERWPHGQSQEMERCQHDKSQKI
jgi:hypothetical protein